MSLRNTASKDDYTLDTICALFLEEKAEEDAALAKRYEQVLGKFCDHEYRGQRIGKLLVNAELDKRHLQSWAETFESSQTQRTYISNVRTALNWALKKKDINIVKSPLADLKPPKTESRAVFISKDEHEALIEFWENDCYCDFLKALWCTGARPGEIAKIEKKHLQGALWKLAPTEHKTGRKTGKDRMIGVVGELAEIVTRLSERYPEGPIFRNTYGRPWNTQASHTRFESARNAGIIRPEVTPYAYRHAWATHALEQGNLTPYEVAKALGHQSLQMILLHYDHSRKNAEHMEGIFERAKR